ncbi:MAG: NAD(+)/NADH kinase [Candidatus Gastranaerophilales bacterium]
MNIQKIAICYNPEIQHSEDVKNTLEAILISHNKKVTALDIDSLEEGFDFVFVIGGDGTILKAGRFYAKSQTPIFGVNLGRLGFLSQTSKEEIENSVNAILKGEFILEDRIMLESNSAIALNDFVIKGAFAGRTSRFSLKINNKFVCDYLADGIIIATPTGSTAYGLSAGGPVLTPSLKAFVIVPICPHTLTARPLVVPDSEVISVCASDENEEFLVSVDGQEFVELKNEFIIKKSAYIAKLALLNDGEFYSILKNKLHWGRTPVYNK